MFFQSILLIIGIITLYIGGELFIRGSSKTAYIFGIKPLVVGLVITAFATSCPELFVSILATIRRSQDLAVGNLVGSSICNIGLILGLAAIIRPIGVNASVLKRQLPMLFFGTLIFFIICTDLTIERYEAMVLFGLFLFFTIYSLKSAKSQVDGSGTAESKKKISRPVAFSLLGGGLIGLLIGAHLIVESATVLARGLGISELVIGLSVVAIGTSLPELAASSVASLKGESDISIGNIIGSNVFNIMGIIGIVCMIRPISIDPDVLIISIPILLVYTAVLVPILRTGFKVSRREGVALVVSYFIYLCLIVFI
ncbi:calcium/sodium antiporter [Candidatus Omnitrophota bacterium]